MKKIISIVITVLMLVTLLGVAAFAAKDADDVETVFLAVSDDGEHWERYLDHAVFVEPGAQITGDPIVLRDGELYIMIYFSLKDGVTYNDTCTVIVTA